MEIEDDAEKVFEFYREKTGSELVGKVGTHVRGGGLSKAFAIDVTPAKVDAKDGLTEMVRVFEHETDNHHLTLIFSRAKGEAKLHINVSYMTHK